MDTPLTPLRINCQEMIATVYETDGAVSQEIGLIPLISPGSQRFGIAINLTWIRELHYLTYHGEPLQNWGEKFQIRTQEDVAQLQIWPIVIIGDSNKDIFRTLYARCQNEMASYQQAQKVSLADLRHGLHFEDGVITTLMQHPELVALIDGATFRFPEAYFIGDMTPILSGNQVRKDPDWFRSFNGLPSSWRGVRCELCGSSSDNVLHVVGPSRIVQCQECGLQYDNPRAVVELDSLNKYASDVRDHRNSAKSILRAEQNAATFVNGLKANGAKLQGQSLLEIGCASGELLHLLENSYSWLAKELWGLDLSKRAIEIAKIHFGLRNVFDKELRNLYFPDQKFDQIVVFNTIEHLPDLHSLLSEVYRILKDDGYVLIGSIPNAGCLASQLFPEGFIAKNFPDGQHHYQFTPETLSRLCRETGFEVIKLDGETREPVLDKVKETAIWLSYSCGVPLSNCQNEKIMLKELSLLVRGFQRKHSQEHDQEYFFSIKADDFLTTETLIAFWKREIWSSPYLSDEFDLWLKKPSMR